MAILAGIDEAGYGPTLGPLVLSAAVFRVPDEPAEPDLWRLLSAAVTKTPSAKSSKLLIADSKIVYQRTKKNPMYALELGVLAALGAAGPRPKSLGELVERLMPGCRAGLADHPWYADADLELPTAAGELRVAGHATALADALANAGCGLCGVSSQIIAEGRFNEMVARTRNKAAAHLTWTLKLLWQIWESHRRERLLVCLDKQGGRDSYGPTLLAAFPGAELTVLTEGETSSRYRLTGADGSMEVRFEVGGEDRHLPTALASMTCKYVRELMMSLFNRWWAERAPGVAPTAGYHTDGNRFVKDVRAAAERLGLRDELWIRSR